MNNIQKLAQLGQSIWYDNISRHLITSGELKRMVDEGLRGVTSNPTIFDKAISGSTDYDAQLKDLILSDPEIDAAGIIQALMVRDIQMACDVFRPVYDQTKGLDGYVSIEVTPTKAEDTRATIEEVRDLWKKVARPNLMVKIPSTKEGLPAIRQMIAEGCNINITLIFAQDRYREVADAYISGLEQRAKEGKSLNVVSVASVFVSRVDGLVDDLLDKKGGTRALELKGKAAVANTKLIYQAFKEIFQSPRFAALAKQGARVQRPLWGSTSTKNPSYPDLLYVEPLVGPDTVNTVPPQTYSAILDHGNPKIMIESNIEESREVLERLAAEGISMTQVLQKLETDGVAAFEKSFNGLYENLNRKKGEVVHETQPS